MSNSDLSLLDAVSCLFVEQGFEFEVPVRDVDRVEPVSLLVETVYLEDAFVLAVRANDPLDQSP